MPTQAQLLDLEQGFWEAGADPGYYREHMAGEAVLVFPYGVGMLDYRATLHAVEENTVPWATYRFDDVQSRDLGEAAALLSYRITARREGDPGEMALWATSVYVLRDGGWRLMFHQQTPVE